MDVTTARGRFSIMDRGEGPPLVFLHPFPFSAEAWSAEVAAFSKTMRVIAPSMRGFGGSEGTVGSVDDMADDVAAILDARALTGPVVLGGLSMGGYVALAFARRHAARLRALVLADTRAEPDTEEGRAHRDKSIARVEAGDLSGFVDGLMDKLVGPTKKTRPSVVARVRSQALAAPPAAVVAALRALRDRPDARPGLAEIRVPSLVLVGEEDELTPPASSAALAAGIPGATLTTIPRAGHLSNLEDPEAFRAAIETFLMHVGREP